MLCAQNILAHGASGLVLGPVLAPRTLVRVQPLAMVERDEQGYIKEEALGDWTELKKSAAELTHARPGASVGYVQAARTRLPRWVRTGRAGRLGHRAPRTVRTGYAYQPRPYRTYRVPWQPTGSLERPPSDAPRLPADNMNYLGMRLPGQLQQSNRRSYAFTSQFSDPFL